jgi:hypothetical protein
MKWLHEAIATAHLEANRDNVDVVFMARLAVVSVLLLPIILIGLIVLMLVIR